jgi:pimeloyl-ACP methyl ester carboxylesterase
MTFQAIIEELRVDTAASRTTLRLDTPAMNFPAVAEALAPGVKPIKHDYSLDQRGAATAQYILEKRKPLVQDDCAIADPAPPRALMDIYDVKAQMVAPVQNGSAVLGWVSVHYNQGPRHWSEDDVAALAHCVELLEHSPGIQPASLRSIGDGSQLHAIERGAGQPIVLLHGWGTNSSIWKFQLADLAGQHRLLAVDLRGFGESPALEDPTTNLLAADVKRFLDSVELSDVLLIGWSMGGHVVMAYCREFGSHRLRSIGIVDVSPRLRPAADWPLGIAVAPELHAGFDRWRTLWATDRRNVFAQINSIGFARPSDHQADIAWLVDESMKANPDTAMDLFCQLSDNDFRDTLPDVHLPTLLLYGAQSTSTTPYVSQFMLDTLPNAELTTFSDSGHALMLEEPTVFNQTVDQFAKTF